MPRKPLTAAEDRQARKQARHWLKVLDIDLKQHGLEHLLSPHKRGRRERAHDTPAMLDGIELLVRTAMRERGISRNAALHWWFEGIYKKLKKLGADSIFVANFGPNANAVIARLSRKLRKGGFHKRDIKTLVPREWLEAGVDPEKFTTIPPTKTDNSI
jgi:hypothetical protein